VDGITISVDVTNTGKLTGKEVVQVYVHDRKSKLVRPPKELKGFAKIELQPGETKTVNIALDFRSFAYYDPAYKQWITEDGEFDILIGSSSADICFSETVTLTSSLTLPCLLDRESTVREWLEDPTGKVFFAPIHQMILEHMQITFGGGAGDAAIGMDMTGFMMEMPLLSMLQFQESTLPQPAHVIVEHLLQQVHGK
jgi:beta-glucosidase